MRIGVDLLFLAAGRGGGIERYVRGLLAGFARVGPDHEYVLFTNADCRGTFELAPRFTEIAANVSATFRPAKLVWEQTVLPVQLARERIDVLLAPANIAPIVHRCPTAVIMHDVIPFIRPEVFTRTERLAMRSLFRASALRSDTIITISESSRRDILRLFGVPPERVTVIPGACDEQFRPTPPTPESREALRQHGVPDEYLLYVAAARSYKNVDGLIRAFRLLKDRGLRHSLVITGLADRASADLVALADSLGLARDVVFSGFVDDRWLPALYSAAAALVFPSLYEGFGLPVIEAMACGTPVAAANRTSLPEVVGDAGLLFDPDSPEDIARTIERVLGDAALREQLIARGIARAKAFTWDRVAIETLAALSATVLA
ncbi:MAG TPA: glycosyltransferase family 1 protein [Kofleriaceae bacterium]|nr:glycosyltransferase family 1 protein [Kofleriaceae bacterium]